MQERLVQVRPVKLLDLVVYNVLDEGQQDIVPTVSNPRCARRALLSYRTLRLNCEILTAEQWVDLVNVTFLC